MTKTIFANSPMMLGEEIKKIYGCRDVVIISFDLIGDRAYDVEFYLIF